MNAPKTPEELETDEKEQRDYSHNLVDCDVWA